MENWKEIPGYEKLYQVSDLGRIKSLKGKEKILKPINHGEGYLSVKLYDKDKKCKRFLIHRLVATCFIPNPENKPLVNHKKGLKHDNRSSQLEWSTDSENQKHAYKEGLHKLKGKQRLTIVSKETGEIVAEFDLNHFKFVKSH